MDTVKLLENWRKVLRSPGFWKSTGKSSLQSYFPCNLLVFQ